MTTTFPPRPVFTEHEQLALRVFCGIVDGLASCRFLRTLPGDVEVTFTHGTDGLVQLRATAFDEDDFRSFLTLFRRLTAVQEKARLQYIAAMLGRYISPEKRVTFAEEKQRLTRHLDEFENAAGFEIGGQVAGGEKRMFTPRQAMDLIMNAEVFHSDFDRQADLAALKVARPLLVPFTLEYALPIVDCAMHLAAQLRAAGWVQGPS